MAFFSDEMAAMLETYQAEAIDMMGIFDRLVLAGTQKNSFSPEQINEIFRTAHTIKSSSAMMGLADLSTLTHTMEDLFGIFREQPELIQGKVDMITDTLYGYSDYVKGELARMQAPDYAPADVTALQADLTGLIAKFKKTAPAAAAVKTAAASAAPAQDQAELVLHYAPDCAMVNVRSLVILKQVSGKWQVLRSEPGDLQAAAAAEIIKARGFRLIVPAAQATTVEAFLKRSPYVAKVEKAVGAAAPVTPAPAVPARAAVKTDREPDHKQPAAAAVSPQGLAGALQGNAHKEDKFISLRWDDVRDLQNLTGEFIALYTGFEQMESKLPYARELRAFGMTYERLLNNLLHRVESMTMLTVASLTPQLYRVVREMGRDEGKRVAFEVQGENIVIDRDLYDNIAKPLLHILRNAIDHGIELPAERQAAGKPELGKVTLTVENQGARIVFRVTDDGKGMDPAQILAAGEKKGLLVKPAAAYTRQEALNLIMQPGFTTTVKANNYSGRGVGMDVVRTIADAFGGRVSIESEPGRGTAISMYMPVSVTAVASLGLKLDSWLCYLPLYSLDKIYGMEEAAALMKETGAGKIQLAFGKQQVPVLDLRAVLQVKQDVGKYVLVGHSLDEYFAVIVDDLAGQVTAVNKPLPACLNKEWQLQTGIVNAVLQNKGGLGFSFSAAMLLALAKGGAA
jgi:two-component system chemotaxis sensor kinase CheA